LKFSEYLFFEILRKQPFEGVAIPLDCFYHLVSRRINPVHPVDEIAAEKKSQHNPYGHDDEDGLCPPGFDGVGAMVEAPYEKHDDVQNGDHGNDQCDDPVP